MSDALIPVSAATGIAMSLLYNLDAEQVTVGANAVLRERMQVTGAAATEIARVLNTAPAGTEMALAVRVVGAAVGGTSATFGTPFPAIGTAMGLTDGTNLVPGRSIVGPIPDFTNSGFVVSINGMLGNNTSIGAINPFALPIGAYRNPTAPSADGKYGSLALDASGNLRVAIMSGAGSGGTAMVDGAAFTLGTSNLTPIGGVFQSALPTDLTNNQTAVALLTKKRALQINPVDSTGVEMVDTALHALNVKIVSDPAGSAVDTDDELVARNQANLALAISVLYGADGAAPSANARRIAAVYESSLAVKAGGLAIAHGTNPTAVAAGAIAHSYLNRAGVPFVMGGHPNIITIEAAFTAAQTDVALVTIGAGLKIVVTRAALVCANSNTVDVSARIGFGTANTPTTTGVVLTHPGIAPGSGFASGSGAGMLGVGADNEDLRITCSVPTTGSVRALISYFTVES